MIVLLFNSKRLSGAVLLHGVAGCAAVEAQGVENYDVSTLIASHKDYSVCVNEIVKIVGF